MLVRSYRSADLTEVTAMWRASRRAAFHYVPLHQTYTPEDDLGFFRDVIAARYTVWLAEDDQRIVGFMALNDAAAAHAGPVVLEQLFIAVDRQRQGIGSLLLAMARRLAPRGLRLFTFQRNDAARAFYEGHGFSIVRFGISPAPESEPDVEYEWVP
jgi:ribosomal protein S18 acetylase RimI-like enzyme